MSNDPVDNLTIIEIYEMISGYKVGTNRRRDRKTDGDVYMVMCCFHADNDPSLQLFTATNGYYCYGCKRKGGKLQAVIAAGEAGDYNDAADWLRKQLGVPARERKPLRDQPAAAIERRNLGRPDEPAENERFAGIWQFHDIEGTLLYEELRFDRTDDGPGRRKRFVMRRPDRRRPTGYAYNLEGVERVPYAYGRLRADCEARRAICYLEGARKAKALHAFDIPATAHANGNNWTVPVSWRSYFTGARAVFVVGDSKEEGRAGAFERAVTLSERGRPAYALDLYPEREDDSDIMDFLEEREGWSADAIVLDYLRVLDRARATPLWGLNPNLVARIVDDPTHTRRILPGLRAIGNAGVLAMMHAGLTIRILDPRDRDGVLALPVWAQKRAAALLPSARALVVVRDDAPAIVEAFVKTVDWLHTHIPTAADRRVLTA
jgi:CHC2 zinc finger